MNPTDPKHKPLRVGPTTLFPAGIIRFQEYPSGETGIEVITDKRKRHCYIATVSLVPYGAPSPGAGGVWLKGWSENEGVPRALELAGIVRLTGRKQRTGFVHADHGELTERALQVRDHQGYLSAVDESRSSLLTPRIDQLESINRGAATYFFRRALEPTSLHALIPDQSKTQLSLELRSHRASGCSAPQRDDRASIACIRAADLHASFATTTSSDTHSRREHMTLPVSRLDVDRATREDIRRELAHFSAAPAQFFHAWKRGVALAGPQYFGREQRADLDRAASKWDLAPKMTLITKAIGPMSGGEKVFIAALTSFYNSEEGGRLLRHVGVNGLADLGNLDLQRRTVIADLLLNYSGW